MRLATIFTPPNELTAAILSPLFGKVYRKVLNFRLQKLKTYTIINALRVGTITEDKNREARR